VSNQIELDGRIVGQPELRITPSGHPLLRFRIDCGEREGELVMPVVMVGGEARSHADRLVHGQRVRLTGALRPQGGRPASGAANPALEIAADEITVVAQNR
jgi:single-stranded DNA-binding protein